MIWKEIIFFFFAINKDFDLIEENNTGIPLENKLTTGDLLMRKIDATGLYHAGVYCGKKCVIEFTAPENLTLSDHITSVSSTGQSGTVSKKSVKTFIANKPYIVLRPKKAIPENFSDLVEEAMDYNEIYNLLTNNCLHFALRLLGLKPAPVSTRWCLAVIDDLSFGMIGMEVLNEKAACVTVGIMLATLKYNAPTIQQITVLFKHLKQLEHLKHLKHLEHLKYAFSML